MYNYLTYHKIIDKLNSYQISTPRLNSFGYGNLIDFGKNVSGTTVIYPFMFVVPQSIQYDENTTTYQLTCIFADRLNETLDNEVDAVSDMSLVARELLSTIKRGFLQDYMEVILPQQAQPFMERYNDNVAGVALDLNVIVYEDINACPQYAEPTPSPSPTSSPTPSPSPTASPTSTPTPSPTCVEITQYLEVKLEESTKFKLILWNQPDFTEPTTALCDYVISGCAYGSLGTIYCGTELIQVGQHQHQFNLAPVLLPGEIVTGFIVDNYYTSGCECPINLILPSP